MREIVPASLGAGLHAHCSEEMGILASRSDPAKKNGGKPTS